MSQAHPALKFTRYDSINDLNGYLLFGARMIREPERKQNATASEPEAFRLLHELFQRSRPVKSQNSIEGFSVTRREGKLINFSKSPERKS